MEVSRHGLWDFSLVTGEHYLTPGFLHFLGYGEYETEPGRRGGFGLIHPEDRDTAERLLREHLEGVSAEYAAEVRLRTKTGGYLHVLSRGKVISRDADGKPLRMVGIHIDLAAVAAVGQEEQSRQAS